jgi:hypothetical protein
MRSPGEAESIAAGREESPTPLAKVSGRCSGLTSESRGASSSLERRRNATTQCRRTTMKVEQRRPAGSSDRNVLR